MNAQIQELINELKDLLQRKTEIENKIREKDKFIRNLMGQSEISRPSWYSLQMNDNGGEEEEGEEITPTSMFESMANTTTSNKWDV